MKSKLIYLISLISLILGLVNSERPEAKVLLPIRRYGSEKSQWDVGQCGGIKQKKANTLTNPGATLDVVWETVNPEATGICSVFISDGFENEKNFSLLYPKDNFNPDGSFDCGRVKGFESKSFKLPEDLECEECILQWRWSTSQGTYYSCSDIIINGTLTPNCMSKCQHGGICSFGQCHCINGYIGQFCEGKPRIKIPWLLIFLIILLIAIIGLLIWFFCKKRTRAWATDQYQQSNNPFENSEYFPDEDNSDRR